MKVHFFLNEFVNLFQANNFDRSKVNAKLIAQKHDIKYGTFHHRVSTSATSRQVKGSGHASGGARKSRKLRKGSLCTSEITSV